MVLRGEASGILTSSQYFILFFKDGVVRDPPPLLRKSASENANCQQQIRVLVKREPVWMNEQGPADRGRSWSRESCEDYCSLQLRDGTEANMTPVIHM